MMIRVGVLSLHLIITYIIYIIVPIEYGGFWDMQFREKIYYNLHIDFGENLNF